MKLENLKKDERDFILYLAKKCGGREPPCVNDAAKAIGVTLERLDQITRALHDSGYFKCSRYYEEAKNLHVVVIVPRHSVLDAAKAIKKRRARKIVTIIAIAAGVVALAMGILGMIACLRSH